MTQEASQAMSVFDEVRAERARQDEKFPDQHLPNGTSTVHTAMADFYKGVVDAFVEDGELTWTDVLTEEFLEVTAEEDPARLRAELVQVAAVAIRWIEDIDR